MDPCQNKVKEHVQKVDGYFNDFTVEQMTVKNYRLLKGVYSNESLKYQEAHTLHSEMYRWNESDVNSTHFNLPNINMNANSKMSL